MKRFVKENKNLLLLFWVIIFQILIVFTFFSKKEGYFIDEVLSFSLSNREGTGYYDPPVHMWLNKEWYLQNMTAQEGSTFDFRIAYHNQEQDVSPPLYYMMLHGVCSLFPGKLSPWMGLGLNLFFYVGSIILLYFLGKKIFHNEKVGLLIAFLFGITYGAVNMVMFLRMYMMATFMLLFHVSVYIHYFEKEHIPVKGYLLFIVSAVLGSLTQYYFLVGAVFLGVWYSLKFLYEKRYVELVKYYFSAGASAIIAIQLFPAMIRHILRSGRGAASFESLSSGDNYVLQFKEMFRILNYEMFGKTLLVLAGALVVGIFVLILKKKDLPSWEKRYRIPIAVACVGYFMVVTKVAPYQTDRYIMPVFPLAYFLVVGAFYAILRCFFKERRSLLVCVLIFGGLAVAQLVTQPFDYLYEGYQKRNVAEEYTNEYCMVISDDTGYWHYDLQALTQYQSFYWLKDIENQELVENIAEKIEPENSFVLYSRNTWDQEEIYEYINENFGGDWIFELQENCNNARFLIYHCRRM